MNIYVFGNRDVAEDARAFEVMDSLKGVIKGVSFVPVAPNGDVPFLSEHHVLILDVIAGLSEVTLIDFAHIDSVVLPPRTSAHDFDLGFQLKYLKKLGKLGDVSMIGLPMYGDLDYDRIHSIFKKLVAQDIHGS